MIINKSSLKKIVTAAAALTGFGLLEANASSHREAPSIAKDPCADNTDVYAFISPNNPDNLVVVANYIPLLLPYSGPNFYSFCDDVAYDINIDNDGDARTDITYRFLFETTVQNGRTFLYNVGAIDGLDSANLNVRQRYDVLRFTRGQQGADVVAENVRVAPWNVGSRSFPNNSYEGVARQAVTRTADGVTLFAGPRDEPFFVDLHVFDLLGVGGFPATNGANVMSLVAEIPIDHLVVGGERPADAAGVQAIVGIHATASRQRTTTVRRGRDARARGPWVQISRLGWPLVNEVIVPLQDKDRFNGSEPQNDLASIGGYVLFPEISGLLSAVLGLPCPAAPVDGRLDIAGLLSPNGTTIADLLRINVAVGQTFGNAGFPNGRKLTDDVTDTLLTVACNAPGVAVADGVNGNDLAFLNEFPYLAPPSSGNP